MQLFSANLQYFQKHFIIFFACENMKKNTLKSFLYSAANFFPVLPTTQNQPLSHFLFHKNVSLRDFYTANIYSGNLDTRKKCKSYKYLP